MKKFLFDKNNFDKAGAIDPDTPIYTEDQLNVARTQSYAQGKNEGIAETRASQEEQISKTLENIGGILTGLAQQEERRELDSMVRATNMALLTIRKLMPDLSQKFAISEIERVITSALESRKDEPRIAITVPTQHMEHLKSRMEALSLAKGFNGKIALLSDDTLSPSDCRVEWADGGAERLYERLLALIEEEFAKASSGIQASLKETDK